MGTLVVRGGDSLKSFVAGGVPNLKFYLLLVDFHLPNLEIDPDCRHEVVSESVVLVKD